VGHLIGIAIERSDAAVGLSARGARRILAEQKNYCQVCFVIEIQSQ